MKTLKKSWIILLLIVALLFVPQIVRAATISRDVYSNNGSMKFTFSDITLDTTHEYEFGLGVTAAATIENWYGITEYTATNAVVDLNYTTGKIKEIMNQSDTIYVTIRDKSDQSVVLPATAVDIKMPYLQLTNYMVLENGHKFDYDETTSINILMRKTFTNGAYYQYQKVTNTELINKYKELKSQTNPNYLVLEEYITESEPSTGWTIWEYWNQGFGHPQQPIEAPGKGLYYMWIQFSQSDLKTLYGVILVDNLDGTEPAQEEPKEQETPTTGGTGNFNNAKITTEKDSQNVKVKISNFTLDENNDTHVILSDSMTPPSISSSKDLDENNARKIISTYIKEGVYSLDSDNWNGLFEQNKDVYAHIVETKKDELGNREYSVVKTIKLSKPSEPKYSDAFFATHVAKNSTQIVTNFTHGSKNPRKMQIKIGKITDTSILQKIKNQDSTGFASLMTYAKGASSLYDKTVDIPAELSSIEYIANDSHADNEKIDLTKKLDDEAYYFLYVKTLDENGKWVSNEAVTLAQADVFGADQDNSWYLFFYGESSFKWADFGNVEDPTIAPTPIPQTGQSVIVAVALLSVVGLGVYTHRRLKNYRDVR